MNHEERIHRMTVSFMLTVLLVLGLTITATAIAQSTGVPLSDTPLVGSAGKIGLISALFSIAIQIAKSDLLGGVFAKIDKTYQPAVVLLLGQILGLIEAVATGKPFSVTAIEWLMSSGNAMALYTVIFKPFTKKKS